MDRRRPLLVAAGAALSLLAGLPATLSSASTPAQRVAVQNAIATERLPTAGSTTVIPTSKTYDGRPRTFVLHIPEGLLAPAPLVVALHARSHTADRLREISDFEALADREGFVVAFPSGAGGAWNAGICCDPSAEQAIDDVAFLDEVLQIARTKAPIDPTRISMSGGSNGAMMALRYACERADVIASAAVVSAPLVTPCTPSGPVPVLVLHGAKDAAIPLAGGPNTTLGVTFPPVSTSLEPFRAAGAEVDLRVIERAGHAWMTAAEHGVDATGALWEWMRDHPRTG